MRDRVALAALILGFMAAGLALWKIVAAFLWLCHYAGLPM